jgi:hypothetical protein
MAARDLFHIGYQKTGSTWLQTHYFTRRDAGFAFTRERKTVPGGIDGLPPGRYIFGQPLFHYDPLAVRRAVDAFFAADVAAGFRPVISNEQLAGNPASGGWQAKEYAWRLSSSFPDAQIFLVVREQRTMIRSCYMQYLNAGGGMSLRDFMVAPQEKAMPLPDLYFFRYDRLLRHYRELFPRDQVLCLPYELFRDRPAEFFATLDAFAGATSPTRELPVKRRENPGEGMLQYPVRRMLNPLIVRSAVNGRSLYAVKGLQNLSKRGFRFIGRHTPKAWDRPLVRRWERRIEETTAGFFEESNRALSEMIGIDLGQLGWRV